MSRKRINVILIPDVFDWRIIIFLVIVIALPCCESRARNIPSTQKLTGNKMYKLYKSRPLINYVQNDWQKGNLHIKQKSWDSVSGQQQKENVYMHESFSVNVTHNDTKELLAYSEQNLSHKRFKRGVLHLYNMVICATGCNPLAYKGYGCYCGFLGSGYALDGIDRCCKMHDWCYDATDCAMFSEYFVPYYWKCYHGYKPVCAVEHGNWGGSGSCAQRLCECDRSFAECLRRYPCPTTKAMCTSSPWRLVQNLFMIM
nr:PREDICTED: uncharacterized protein LOC100877091 [Megachile rotundata]XP_012137615.1 PREDICTED: uncharacterized protein LOC100877091 [Megachile rotundata]XP_012137616.1 PREDICTED: uncharacterized protein LOC100877091 [Megachile rotundata]XP_012137617.1 PREDICTED: uncharacterized protein LOC100877091 [Megachile rotundata]